MAEAWASGMGVGGPCWLCAEAWASPQPAARPGPQEGGSGRLLLWRMKACPFKGSGGGLQSPGSLVGPSNPFGFWPQVSGCTGQPGALLSEPRSGQFEQVLAGSVQLLLRPNLEERCSKQWSSTLVMVQSRGSDQVP